MKAKKSLTNSFDQLLKRKPSKESFNQSQPVRSASTKVDSKDIEIKYGRF